MTQEPIPSHGAQVRGRELVLDRCSRPEREKKKGVAAELLLGGLIQRLKINGSHEKIQDNFSIGACIVS